MKGASASIVLVAMLFSGCTEAEIDFVTATTSSSAAHTTVPKAAANGTLSIIAVDALVDGTTVTASWNVTGSSKIQSRFEYGPSQALGTNSGYRFGPGPHEFTVPDLTPGATYFWRVHAVDGAKAVDSAIRTFTAGSAADTIPPALSGIQVSSISHTGARVHWSLSEDSGTATSFVKYGTQSGAYANQSASQEGTASLSIQLSQLSPATTYYFTVRASDAAGNIAESVQQTFTTLAEADTTAPTVTSVSAGTPTSNSVTISWSVGDDSGSVTSQVEYGLAAGSYTDESTIQTGTGVQAATLSSLSGSTTYHFRVHAVDGSGNPANSADQTFTTSAAPNPPPTLSGVASGQVGETSAVISWTVQDATGTVTSWVKWGQSAGSYTLGTGTTQTGTGSKTYTITGLSASTTYHAKVFATDGTTEVPGDDIPFTTTAAPQAPEINPSVQISSVKKDRFTVSWTVTGPTDMTSRVVYGPGAGTEVGTQTGPGSKTFTVTGLSEAMAYAVRIRASAPGFSDDESTTQTQYTADELVYSIVDNNLDDSYSPKTRTVSAATPFMLLVTNNHGQPHTLKVTEGLKTATLEFGATGQNTSGVGVVLTAQTYTFFCAIHTQMTGTLVVT